jgi:hypothetical protein
MFGLRGILRPKARWFVPVSFPATGLRGVRGWFKGSLRGVTATRPRKPRRESVGTVTVTVRFK